MHVILDPDSWLCTNGSGIPLLCPNTDGSVPIFMPPCHWSSVLQLLRSDIAISGVLHDKTQISLSRSQALAISGVPKAIQIPDCPRCHTKMKFRIGQVGGFFGCSSYPNCQHKKNAASCILLENELIAKASLRDSAEDEGTKRNSAISSSCVAPNPQDCPEIDREQQFTDLIDAIDRIIFPAVAGTAPRASRRTSLNRWREVIESAPSCDSEEIVAALEVGDPSLLNGRKKGQVILAVQKWCESRLNVKKS